MKIPYLDKLKKLYRKEKSMRRIIVCIGLSVVLSILVYFTYNEYKKTVINQQQNQMLSIARSISRSIDLYIGEISNSMQLISLDQEFSSNISNVNSQKSMSLINQKLKTYNEAQDAVDIVSFYNQKGELISAYPETKKVTLEEQKTELETAIAGRSRYIGKVYFDNDKGIFVFKIYEPVYNANNFKGLLVIELNIEDVYTKLIEPVKIGEKGYALIKDQDGIIIMHQLKEQVGIDVIDTRKQLHPELDFTELEDLIDRQLKGEEGTAIYHSYWWWEESLVKAKKLNAFTPVKFGDHFWVVAVTMSYDEVEQPITRFLVIVLGIVILIVIIIYIFLTVVYNMRKNRDKLEKEKNYLKILNDTSEKLRKKEAELYHSNKLKMIGTLAGGIAHDVNNLLTPILGYSELLLMRTPEDSEDHEDISEILNAAKKGKNLIGQILTFSRSENAIIKVESVIINEALKETLKLFKAVLPRKIKLIEDIKEDCGIVNANFVQIHQVIFNLCNNACQAIKNNKGTIKISLNNAQGEILNADNKQFAKNKNYVEIIITDDGCGMDKETIDRIFDPFFTTKDIGDGTGLGLYVVQSIIDKYEGVIIVESEVGKGSSFKVYLPLASEEVTSDEEIYLSESMDKKDVTVLLVDDIENNIKVLRKALEHFGYNVISETNSLRALEIFQQHYQKIDIVITDQVIPDLKGSELAFHVKEIKPKIPVILMSGYVEEEKNTIDYDYIDECIAKPIEIKKLIEIIQKYIK